MRARGRGRGRTWTGGHGRTELSCLVLWFSFTVMASFVPERTPARGVSDSRRPLRDNFYGLATRTTSTSARDSLQRPTNTRSSISSVNHRIQHHEDELEEIKLRQQQLEEQLVAVQQENIHLKNEVL